MTSKPAQTNEKKSMEKLLTHNNLIKYEIGDDGVARFFLKFPNKFGFSVAYSNSFGRFEFQCIPLICAKKYEEKTPDTDCFVDYPYLPYRYHPEHGVKKYGLKTFHSIDDVLLYIEEISSFDALIDDDR